MVAEQLYSQFLKFELHGRFVLVPNPRCRVLDELVAQKCEIVSVRVAILKVCTDRNVKPLPMQKGAQKKLIIVRHGKSGIVFADFVVKTRFPRAHMIRDAHNVLQRPRVGPLRHGGRVADYLKDFPEYKSVFSHYRSQVHSFTRNLHQNYLDCFVFKKKPFAEFPAQYKTHMFVLNKKYIEELRENKNSVTFNYVVEFINNLNPGSLLFSLNYVVKEHKKEIQRVEEPIAGAAADAETQTQTPTPE
jgi:hypothetical protein